MSPYSLHWQAGSGFVKNQWTDAYAGLPTLDGIEYRRRDGTVTVRYSAVKGVLPHDGVMRHFTQYGASSKRQSNEAVGYLGIGCKSGFAYADSFTVTSWHGGRKRVYAAIIDASGAGEMRLLDEEACGNETGLAVSVPVRPRDVSEFVDKARDFYRFFDPQPLCNYNLAPPVWGMRHGTDRLFYAVMGCVAYPIDLLHIRANVSLSDKHGAFRFDIGTLDVAASREALKYSDRTKAALTAALTLAHQSVVAA